MRRYEEPHYMGYKYLEDRGKIFHFILSDDLSDWIYVLINFKQSASGPELSDEVVWYRLGDEFDEALAQILGENYLENLNSGQEV
jgi:hypothetical protein